MKDNNKIGGKGGKRRRRKQSSKTIWKTSCRPLIRPCGLIANDIQSKYVFTPLKIRHHSHHRFNQDQCYILRLFENSRPCGRSFRVWLECRKIERKWPPRFARRQTRIIYRQCNKSHEKAVSVENLRVVSPRAPCKSIYFTNGKSLHPWKINPIINTDRLRCGWAFCAIIVNFLQRQSRLNPASTCVAGWAICAIVEAIIRRSIHNRGGGTA